MARVSGFRGNWQPNRRPYVVLAPDAYVAVQGETTVVACGECRREVNINRYLTGVSVDAAVDSPPGSATVNLSIPDNDVNEFYVEDQFVLIPMMEIEVFAKGYYTVGGFPQYYRIFWGLIQSVTKSWSNGVTTVTISCRDILRWWELTNVVVNPAFLDIGKSQSGYNLFGNKFSGANPYTVIIALAKEAMGDFSITTGSFTSFRPETGPEQGVIAAYAKDIMAYWQLKFGNIWNSLVLYGTSGQAYTFAGDPGNVSPVKISREIFAQEAQNLSLNRETSLFKIQPHEIAAFKVEVPRAGEVDFFQNETQTKLSLALTARDQAGGYEFYCDTTGDIVFKPPFYNLNVLPNKPVSWINDFEIIDDSITDSEQEVFTHVTSHGNAFGGVTDWGLNDDITTPRTGVIDWHLLKRYGWRRLDVQIEWAGNPKKLFYHLLDHIDKVNARRVQGSVTIPMRPELRMGFPVWIPKYDSFFYIQGISHNFSPGGQATTTLTLIAKRSKFIAPKNIGRILPAGIRSISSKDPRDPKKTVVRDEPTYKIEFPSNVGQTSGLADTGQDSDFGGPAILRDAKTGKLLGFPNAVMVYRSTLNGEILARILEQSGSTKANKPKTQDKKSPEGPSFKYSQTVGDVFVSLQNDRRAQIIDRLRSHRYESGMTNAGAYDYAHDVDGRFKEFSVIPADRIEWGSGTQDPEAGTLSVPGSPVVAETIKDKDARRKELQAQVNSLKQDEKQQLRDSKAAQAAFRAADKAYKDFVKKNPPQGGELSPEAQQLKNAADRAKFDLDVANDALKFTRAQISALQAESAAVRKLAAINIMVRPVSDEFGFEVIGHYRYGRGAFIDRGQVQLPDPNVVDQNRQSSINKLNIQFAAHGGLLTDNPTETNLGPESRNFSEAFERMTPDDYVTAASFKGANYQEGKPLQEVNPTGQATYTDAINLTSTRGGKAVFAEADALRRAVTLAELSPVTKTGLDAVGFNRCSCDLGRTQWLSVLPQAFLRQILGPVSSVPVGGPGLSEEEVAEAAAEVGEGIAGVVGEEAAAAAEAASAASSGLVQSADVAQAGSQFSLDGPEGFFSVLRQYMSQIFTTNYQENVRRERFAVSGGRTVSRPNEGVEASNILGDPANPLFDRAALGDPDALRALQGEANFSFGRSERALSEFKDQFRDGGLTDQLQSSAASLPGSVFDPATGGLVQVSADDGPSRFVPAPSGTPQFQPPARQPRIGETINPGMDPNGPILGSGT